MANKNAVPPRNIKKFIDEMKKDSHEVTMRKQMSWELLLQIKGFLLSSPTYKHARECMGIHKHTWHRWKQEGDEYLNSIDANELDPEKLDERQKQLITFVYYLRITKQKMIRKHWNNMEELGKKDYRALQFILKVLDPETFNIENKMKMSGYVESSSEAEQARIAATLAEFMPKDGVDQLEAENDS